MFDGAARVAARLRSRRARRRKLVVGTLRRKSLFLFLFLFLFLR
jgi:hypothetical protein